MADPAQKSDNEETPGTAPSTPEFGSDQLRQAEEESIGKPKSSSSNTGTGTSKGKVNYSHGKPEDSESSQLGTSTTGDKAKYTSADVNPSGGSLYNSSATKPGVTKYFTRRNGLFGGAALGIGGAVILTIFTILSGPFQFIHIAQLLEEWHFASLQNLQDDRFNKQIRLYRYAKAGEIEKTRLGYLGNKMANTYEAKLNKTGLKSSYSDLFGYHDGYVIDTTSESSPYKGLEGEALQDEVERVTGVRPVLGKTVYGSSAAIADDYVISVKNTKYFSRLKLNYSLLSSAEANKVSAAVGTRFLCVRAGCTSLLHPLSVAIGKTGNAIEEWWKSRNATDENGNKAIIQSEDDSKDKSGAPVEEQVNEDTKAPLTADDIRVKLGASAVAAAGILCVAKSINSQAKDLKKSQVQILIRMAVEATALGNQLESGVDVNESQLDDYNNLLEGKDANGNQSSWDETESIQANQGNPNTGIPPSGAVKNVTNDSVPFDFLNQGIIGSALGLVCGTVGTIIGVLTGGVEGIVTGVVVSAVLAQTGFLEDLASWLAGSPINVDAVGAEYGSEIDYGAGLAANAQSTLAGGTQMTDYQATALNDANQTAAQQEFNKHSLAYRLFSTDDSRSAIAKVLVNVKPSLGQNVTSIGSYVMDFSRYIGSFGNMLTGLAHAVNTGYNYGFPAFGYTDTDLNNQIADNPYENACYVVGCQDENGPGGTSGPIIGFLTGTTDGGPADAAGEETYIKKAQDCFAVNIAPDANGEWDVTGSSDPLPYLYDSDYTSKDCNDPTDANWLRLRMFILDTETMNSMACAGGNDADTNIAQACTDVGFGGTTATTTGTAQ